jgi:uncharacterized protein (UPF0333 family)
MNRDNKGEYNMNKNITDNKGQTLTEYALTLLFIMLAVFVMLGYFGDTLFGKYSYINSSLPK